MSVTMVNLMIAIIAAGFVLGAAWHDYDERNDER